MTVKTQIIALAVRLVSDKTTLIRKPDAFTAVLSELFGEESYDVRIAKDVEAELDRAAAATKRFIAYRQTKKINK